MTDFPTIEQRLATAIRVAFPLEAKLAGSTGELVGYGAIFGNADMAGDVIRQGAFAKSLARHRAEGTVPAMLWSHDPAEPIGLWREVREDDKGLYVAGKLDLETQRGREALALTKSKAVTGLSIGFSVRQAERAPGDARRILTEVELWEVSLVTLPANRQARITDVKGVTSREAFEELLRGLGFPKSFASDLSVKGWPRDGAGELHTSIGALASRVATATINLKGKAQ